MMMQMEIDIILPRKEPVYSFAFVLVRHEHFTAFVLFS